MDLQRLIVVKTICIIAVFTVKGIYLELYGPTLIDLRLLFDTTYEQVSGAITGRGSGGFIGSLVGGILADRFEVHLDIFVAVAQATAGLALMLIPMTSSVTVLWALVNLIGFAAGIGYIAYTRLMIMMWKSKASFYVQLMSIGYPTGALLGPLLARPFMAVLDFDKSTDDAGKNDAYHVIKESRVNYLYVIVGLLAITSSLPFFIFYTVKSLKAPTGYKLLDQHDPDTIAADVDPHRNTEKPKMKLISFLTFLIVMFFIHIGGGTGVFGVFIRSFSADVFKFSNEESSNLNTMFWVSVITTRVFGTYAAKKIHIRPLLTMQAAIYLVGASIVWMCAAMSPRALWICTIIQGVSQATLFASGIAYSNFRLEVTGTCLMCISFAGYAGDLAYIWTSGSLYDSFGAQAILDTIFVSAICVFFTTVLFRITERFDHSLKR